MLENLMPETRSPCSALNFECEAWKDIAVREPMEDASAATASTTSLNTLGQEGFEITTLSPQTHTAAWEGRHHKLIGLQASTCS